MTNQSIGPLQVWADRLPRQRLMVTSDLVRASSQGILAALLLTDHAHLWHLLVLQGLHGTASAFFYPAATGMVRQTVPSKDLQRANALLGLASSGGAILGPTLAGAMVAATGSGWALAVDSLSFVASASLLVQLRGLGRVDLGERRRFRSDLAAGWREVAIRRWLWTSILGFGVFQFAVLGSFYVFGPVVSRTSLGGARAWGLILGGFGAGQLTGGVLALHYRPDRPLLATFGSMLGFVPALALLGMAAPLPYIVAVEIPAGMAFTFANAVWETALQSNVPEESLSRVAAYDWIGSFVFRPLGFALMGPIGVVLGVRTTLFAVAVLTLADIGVLLGIPDVRRLRSADRAALVREVRPTDESSQRLRPATSPTPESSR